MACAEFFSDWEAETEEYENDDPQPDTNAPLERLPPGPTRSLGGYLDYAGWRDFQRFRELDRALLGKRAQEDDVESEDRQHRPLRRCSERCYGRLRCRNRFRITRDYIGSKCEEHRFGGRKTEASLDRERQQSIP